MWQSILICTYIACLARADTNAQESKIVHIAQGPVRGYKDPETGVYSFQSIPYAKTPTGPNRFKAPLPPPTWMHPLEAVDKSIGCPQWFMPFPGFPDLKLQEDCLIANVFVPNTQEKNLPVVVNVHGGGFQGGSNAWVPVSKMIPDYNIILVTVNYRLGIHGFLCLGTEDIPGNAGMKDLIAALRWVKNNIASFGGNPDDVTIQGGSAGSAAVDLLMLSKSAEGLFNKVIPESGGSIAQWTIQSDPLENAKKIARDLNFTNVNDIYALEDFFKTVSFKQLTSMSYIFNPDSTLGPSPCVERATAEEVFLDRSPVDILRSGDYKKVPVLYGFADMEGLMRLDLFDVWKDSMNEKFSDFLPGDLKFESKKEKEEVAKQVKEFYFRGEPIGEKTILSFVDYFSDVLFGYSMLRSVKYHVDAGHDQIFLYEFSFVDNNTPYVPHTKVKGANHCAQTVAVFGGVLESLDPNTKTKEFLEISSTLNKIWANFIKTGKPIPEGSSLPAWPAVGAGWSPHMSIGTEFQLRGPLLERRMRFWDEIYSKHYRDPIPPPEPAPRKRTEL